MSLVMKNRDAAHATPMAAPPKGLTRSMARSEEHTSELQSH